MLKCVKPWEMNTWEMGAEIAENLWGVVFDIPDDANFELGLKRPSRVERVDDFGIHELNWQPTLNE